MAGALQQSQHPLWSHVSSWHDTDGEGRGPTGATLFGWCFAVILKPVGTGKDTHASPGVELYHLYGRMR